MHITNLRQLLESVIADAVNGAIAGYKQLLDTDVGAAAPIKKKLGRPPGAKNKVHAAAPAPAADPAQPGARKDPRQVANEQAAAAVLAFITTSPGLRGDQIARGMGGTSTTVNKGLAKLRTTKQVKTKGKRRGTTYYPAGASAAPAKASPETLEAAKSNGAAEPVPAKAKKGKRRKGVIPKRGHASDG